MANHMHIAYTKPLSDDALANLVKAAAKKLSLRFSAEKFQDVLIFSVQRTDEWVDIYTVSYSNFGEGMPDQYKNYGSVLEVYYENSQMLVVDILNEIFLALPDAIVTDLGYNFDRDAHIATASDVKNFKGTDPYTIFSISADV